MILGIIAAMEEELQAVRQLMTDVEEKTAGNKHYYQGLCEGVPVVLTLCGVGKVNAAMHTQLLIDHFRPDCILNVGSAGACKEGFAFGDVIVASSLVQHDFDITAFPNRVKGELPDLGVNLVTNEPMTKLLLQSVQEAGLREYLGVIASGDQFIETKEKKTEIYEEFQALCCEMEGAAIAQVCLCNEVAFSVLRGISDVLSDDSHMDFDQYLEIAANNCGVIVKQLCENIGRNDSYFSV